MTARRNTVLACLVSLMAIPAASAQYDLSWYTIDGGGAMFSTGGSFSLGGTIGQPDAGVMSGGTFTLSGGFWPGASNPCELLADLDNDGDVDIGDLAQMLSHFGTASGATFSDGDVDGDGDVDIGDLAFLLSVFGTSC